MCQIEIKSDTNSGHWGEHVRLTIGLILNVKIDFSFIFFLNVHCAPTEKQLTSKISHTKMSSSRR